MNSWTDPASPDEELAVKPGPGNKGSASTETALGCSNRIWKATFYVWSGNEVVAEYNLQDELLTQYIIANGTRVARLTPTVSSKDTLYLHHDRAGSLRMVTSRTGTVVQKLSYDAFGEVVVQVGSSSIDYTYTGQDWESEWGLNLFYLRNRYYNPAVGRFLTPDPLVSDLNPYSYCNNNPVMFRDPYGLNPGPTGPAPGDPDYVDPNYRPRLNANGDPWVTPSFSGSNPHGGFWIFGRLVNSQLDDRPTTASRAGFGSRSDDWMGNEGQWALIEAEKQGVGAVPALRSAIAAALNAGHISQTLADGFYLALDHTIFQPGLVNSDGGFLGGMFDPTSNTIWMNESLKDNPTEFLAYFAKESFHFFGWNKMIDPVREMVQMVGRNFDISKNLYSFYGPVAWQVFDFFRKGYRSNRIRSDSEALKRWSCSDGCGGNRGVKTIYGPCPVCGP